MPPEIDKQPEYPEAVLSAKYFKAEKINDDGDNGGERTSTLYLTDVKNNVIPTVSREEAESGLTRYRKIFIAVSEDVPYLRHHLLAPTDSYDAALLHEGTVDDTQAALSGYTSWKGCGLLKSITPAPPASGIGMGNYVIEVEAEVEGEGFNISDMIRISDGITEDFVRAKSVSWVNNVATVTALSGSVIVNSYAPSGAYVSACIEKGVIGISPVWLREDVTENCPNKNDNILRIRTIL